MQTTDEPIIIEQALPVSKAKLWQAITNPEEMKQWFFEVMPDFKAEVGFQTSFTLSNEGRVFPHNWKVVSVVPEESIAVEWTFDGYPGVSLVTYEISGDEKSSHIKLTAKALQDHPTDIPEFKRESGVGGWKYFINDRLVNYLNF